MIELEEPMPKVNILCWSFTGNLIAEKGKKNVFSTRELISF